MCMCACTVCIYAIKAFNKNKESFVFRMIPFHLMLLLVLFLQHNITHFMAVVVVFPSYSMPLCQWWWPNRIFNQCAVLQTLYIWYKPTSHAIYFPNEKWCSCLPLNTILIRFYLLFGKVFPVLLCHQTKLFIFLETQFRINISYGIGDERMTNKNNSPSVTAHNRNIKRVRIASRITRSVHEPSIQRFVVFVPVAKQSTNRQ